MDFGLTPKKNEALRKRMEALGVREADLEESFIRSGGPGGQHVNRTESCVRLLHRPTGIEVKMQKERSQRLNRYYARKRLCELLETRQMGAESPEAIERAKKARQKARRHRRSRSKPPEGDA